MDPLVEVVIHDLASGTIGYINGTLSKRKVGDPSLLQEGLMSGIDMTESLEKTYTKLSFDGRLVKSCSVIFDKRWMICLNCDVSVFDSMKNLANQLLQSSSPQPKALFHHDWQEQLHKSIHAFLQKKQWSFETLRSAQKKEMVFYLFQQGAFSQKKASDYLAEILHMGRATIFNYLKEWRQK
jgi:predicted transcriptional regulator YheO